MDLWDEASTCTCLRAFMVQELAGGRKRTSGGGTLARSRALSFLVRNSEGSDNVEFEHGLLRRTEDLLPR